MVPALFYALLFFCSFCWAIPLCKYKYLWNDLLAGRFYHSRRIWVNEIHSQHTVTFFSILCSTIARSLCFGNLRPLFIYWSSLLEKQMKIIPLALFCSCWGQIVVYRYYARMSKRPVKFRKFRCFVAEQIYYWMLEDFYIAGIS